MHRPTQPQVSEPNLEKMDFEITLSGTYWGDRNPAFEITVDNAVVVDGKITALPSRRGLPGNDFMSSKAELATYQTEKFSVDLAPGSHVLGVRLKNKLPTDTCGFDDQGNYTRDVLLNIERIKIDGMDLQNLVYEESQYILDKPQEFKGAVVEKLERCVCLGFNGTYQLPFMTPFYIWLLERL